MNFPRIKVVGLTLIDYRCPICDRSASGKLKGKFILCPRHGAIEGVLKIAIPDDTPPLAA